MFTDPVWELLKSWETIEPASACPHGRSQQELGGLPAFKQARLVCCLLTLRSVLAQALRACEFEALAGASRGHCRVAAVPGCLESCLWALCPFRCHPDSRCVTVRFPKALGIDESQEQRFPCAFDPAQRERLKGEGTGSTAVGLWFQCSPLVCLYQVCALGSLLTLCS